MSLKVIDLNDVLLDMDIMLKRLLGEDIELLTVYGAAPAHVKADQDQIGQIIMNIAVNARDAMHGGGKLTIETANAVLDATYVQGCAEIEPGRYVALAFSDNGIGMDAETRSRIFEPFFTTKGKEVGTGLGLSTVFGIVKQHQGHVTVTVSLEEAPLSGFTFPRRIRLLSAFPRLWSCRLRPARRNHFGGRRRGIRQRLYQRSAYVVGIRNSGRKASRGSY